MTDETSATAGSARQRPPGVPRWVKFVAVAVAVIVIVAVGLALAGGGHGPGRHLGGDHSAPAHTAPSPDGGGGHAPPPGAHE